MKNNINPKSKHLSKRQAIELAKKEFREEHSRRIPNHAHISIHPRYSGGRYVLISGGGFTSEFYFD